MMDNKKIVIEECGAVDVLIDGTRFGLFCEYTTKTNGDEQVYVEENGNRVVVERPEGSAVIGLFTTEQCRVKELFDYIECRISKKDSFVCWLEGEMEKCLEAAEQAGGKYPAIRDTMGPAEKSLGAKIMAQMRLPREMDGMLLEQVREHTVPVEHVAEQEPEPAFVQVCKCKVCGTEIDIEDEEGLWGHLQMEHEELFEVCMDWDTPDMIDEYYDVLSVIKVTELDEGIGEVLTLEDAKGDILEYLGQQENDYFSERGTTKEQVVGDQALIENLAVEHMRCVNRYGDDREWSCKDACDVEPGIYVDQRISLSEQMRDADGKRQKETGCSSLGKEDPER